MLTRVFGNWISVHSMPYRFGVCSCPETTSRLHASWWRTGGCTLGRKSHPHLQMQCASSIATRRSLLFVDSIHVGNQHLWCYEHKRIISVHRLIHLRYRALRREVNSKCIIHGMVDLCRLGSAWGAKKEIHIKIGNCSDCEGKERSSRNTSSGIGLLH